MKKKKLESSSPFLDGQLSFIAGLQIDRNPHRDDSEEHWQWIAGWVDKGMKRFNVKFAIPSVQVLEFQPTLSCSVWVDYKHGFRSKKTLEKALRRGIKAGNYLGYRLFAIQTEEIGISQQNAAGAGPDEVAYNPGDCFPRFIAVADGIQATVFDTKTQKDLFPTTTGNRVNECGFGTAVMIAEALNFYEARPLSAETGRKTND